LDEKNTNGTFKVTGKPIHFIVLIAIKYKYFCHNFLHLFKILIFSNVSSLEVVINQLTDESNFK
tara:strand:- start:12822 stop:13013 length:192 start_codon:yes stop_codon:yes gene_type:complete